MRSIGIGSIVLVAACILGLPWLTVASAGETGDAKSSEKLDGKWYAVRQEQFGGPVPDIVARRLSLVIDGNKMEWYIGNPAPNMAATITVDPEKKTIDARVTRGSWNGKTMLGIYKFEDARLHVCWAEIDAKRPEKFASTKPGRGAFEYTIYSRTKDKDEKKRSATQVAGATKKDIRTLQVKLAAKWKDDGTVFGVRRFLKDKIELLAVLHPGKAPATPLDLVDMTRKDANLFRGYVWAKTTGIGKFDGGVFVVGDCKAGASAVGIAMARSVDGVTVLFLGAPADDGAARKEMLTMVKSAHFAPEGPPDVGAKDPPAGKRRKLTAPAQPPKERATVKGLRNNIDVLAISPDGKALVAGGSYGAGGELKLWDLTTGKERPGFKDGDQWVTAGAFSPDGKTLAVTRRLVDDGPDKALMKFYDPEGRNLPTELRLHASVLCLAYSPDSKLLALGCGDNAVGVWDHQAKKWKFTLEGVHTELIQAVAFSPDGKTVASGGYDKLIGLWDAETGKKRTVLKGHTDQVRALAFSPDGQRLASAGWDNAVRLWDPATGEPKATLAHRSSVTGLAFAPDGKTLAAAVPFDDAVVLWDVAGAKERARMKLQSPYRVTFTPDGKTLVVGGAAGAVTLSDVPPN